MNRRYVLFWLIAGTAALAAGIGAGLISKWQKPEAEFSNEQTLSAEAGLAILLALAFYQIQNQNKVRRKQFWLGLLKTHLLALVSDHKKVLDEYVKLHNGISDPRGDNFAKRRVNGIGGLAKIDHMPMIEMAITQVADVLDDPSLFTDIMTYEGRKRLTEYLSGHIFDHADWLRITSIPELVAILENNIQHIEKILGKVQKEMPKQET